MSEFETTYLQDAIDQSLPVAMAEPLKRVLGSTMPTEGEDAHYGVVTCGRFEGPSITDILAFARAKQSTGALVLAEGDAERVLYLSKGMVVGAESTVLFERLGRLLYKAEVVTHEDSGTLVDAEENHGAGALLLWLSGDQLDWAIERRVWEVGGALALVKRGHFVFVEGEPKLECSRVSIEPSKVAEEGMRVRERIKNGTPSPDDEPPPSPMRPAPPAATRELRPLDLNPDTIREVLKRIQEADSTSQR